MNTQVLVRGYSLHCFRSNQGSQLIQGVHLHDLETGLTFDNSGPTFDDHYQVSNISVKLSLNISRCKIHLKQELHLPGPVRDFRD